MQATNSISGHKGTLFVETDVIYYRRRNHLGLQPTTMTFRRRSSLVMTIPQDQQQHSDMVDPGELF